MSFLAFPAFFSLPSDLSDQPAIGKEEEEEGVFMYLFEVIIVWWWGISYIFFKFMECGTVLV